MRIKVSSWWILVIPIVFSLHLQKVWLFIFILLAFHEGAHVLCAQYFGYLCEEVVIYPFGLSARIQYFEYKNSKYEILITLAGLSVHIIMYIVLFYFAQRQYISYSFMHYLNTMNMQILCFNLIPIYPLDGGRIFNNICELIVPYKQARITTLLVSFVMLCVFVAQGLWDSISGILITSFFIIQLLYHTITFKQYYRQFYLYRFIHGACGKLKIHKRHDIYKNRENVIMEDAVLKNEREFLSRFI